MSALSLPQQTYTAADRAASLRRMIDRARNLANDGYSIFCRTRLTNTGYMRPVRGEFVVVNPRGELYEIDVIRQTCNCTCWRRNSKCKHLMGAYWLATGQAWDMIRGSRLGEARYAEGYMMLAALADCAMVCRERAAAERRVAA